jgi:alkylation response protein AidB-like acyl-CoA dehydrogenase
MNFGLTAEQEILRAEARAYLATNPAPSFRDLAELGWTGVGVAEAEGGAGLGFVEEAILHEELGRAVSPGPFLVSVALALPLLPEGEQRAVAEGSTSWTVALGPLVLGLDAATNVAIVGGDGVYELVGHERALLETVDESRPLGVVVGGAPGRRLGDAAALPRARRRLLVALAAEGCGVGARALELAVDHAHVREQFGRPIGSYQAVGHPLARCYVGLELARSLTYWAAWTIDLDHDDAAVAAASAKSSAADAAVRACEQSIQTHGGIGFTWEHPLRALYRRALAIRSLEASSSRLRSDVADRLLEP